MHSNARRNTQRVSLYIPLDADTFTFGVYETWLAKNSPYTKVFGSGDRDAIKNMLHRVAQSLADDGQAALAAEEAGEGVLPSTANILQLFPQRISPKRAAALTIQDLKEFTPDSMHKSRTSKSLEWALEDSKISTEDSKPLHELFRKYKLALEALLKSDPKLSKSKGSGKAKLGPVGSEFSRICNSLGVQFDPLRLPDIVTLMATVKARADSAEE
jgi:hypothetical protein